MHNSIVNHLAYMVGGIALIVIAMIPIFRTAGDGGNFLTRLGCLKIILVVVLGYIGIGMTICHTVSLVRCLH